MDLPEQSPDSIHWADQYDAWRRDTIRRHGWALQAVLGDEDGPPFVYTVGLTGFGHPELILFATAQTTAGQLLNELGELVRAGRQLVAGQRVTTPSGDVHLLTFPEAEHWLFAAEDLYRAPGAPPVPALLVVPVDELVGQPQVGSRGDDRACLGGGNPN
jgi:Domain of unknown function (DUF4262)